MPARAQFSQHNRSHLPSLANTHVLAVRKDVASLRDAVEEMQSTMEMMRRDQARILQLLEARSPQHRVPSFVGSPRSQGSS